MKFWQVDAFTNKLFCGNPAAVFVFDKAPSADLMQKIACEMNLSETAFVTLGPLPSISWFTPISEVDLCGHATLSAAHVLWQEKLVPDPKIVFQSKSGPLTVTHADDKYTLNLPLQPPVEKQKYEEQIAKLVGSVPSYIGSNQHDCMVVIESDEAVRSFSPNYEFISSLEERGFLLTAEDSSKKSDYIYRGFFPKLSILEDPVTGSANTCLADYWSKRLGKNKLKARQVSERGGDLSLEIVDDRLFITGQAITVFEGEFNLPQGEHL